MASELPVTAPAASDAWTGLFNLSDPAAVNALAGNIFLAVMLLLVLAGLYRLAPRTWKAVEETLFSNWRLGLLAATGLVLSLASGWTTWDGMRNFTQEPVLSLMITFGIQGVMLIIAWLIGESFATGMSQRAAGAPRGTLGKGMQAAAGGLVGTLLFVTLAFLLLHKTATPGLQPLSGGTFDAWEMSDQILIVVVGLLLAALVALYSASDVVKPYLQSTRVVAKNAVLWIMFLACMATSVFFSFDSLFSAIFPQSERVRAAELRAQNQVAGIVSDIGATIETRRLSAVDEFFRSEGWQAYESELDRLTTASRGAEGLIEAYYVQKMEERRAGIAEQQERIASAESSQAGLSIKKSTLTEELSRLEAERPALVSDLQQRKTDLDARAKEVDAKRVEAMAEEKGVEGTLREGRGPIYRQRLSELSKLRDYYKIGEQRVSDAQKRLDETNGRIDQLKRQLAEVDGSLAKLRGEADTAQQRISAATASTDTEDEQPKIDPARVLPAFESARIAFRQKPETSGLQTVQEQCNQLLTAMTSAPTTKERVAGIDCDPKRAQEAAGLLFALNSGARMFASNCVGGDKLAAHTSADALFSFSRKCLADSGLPSAETDQLRTRINFIELNRDDKAHRFVVTWNAFQDGNRLAYLALAIAIAIDGLIFMSGLFGANAVRSPLSDVPSHKARSAKQLEDIIENALLPDTFEAARMTLQAMRPITNASGFMAEVRPERLDPHAADRVISVLNAGATIHAVEYDPDGDRYLVRAELFEFLSAASKKAFEANAQHATLAELEKIVAVSLLPDVAANVDTVLAYIHPISERHGFTAEVKFGEVDEAHRRVVRNLLNAGSVHQRVQRAGDTGDHYFIHRDLYQTLARLRARSLHSSDAVAARLAPPEPSRESFGGALTPERHPALTHQPAPSAASETPADTPHAPPPVVPNEMRAIIRDRLLESMNRDPSIYDYLVQNGSLAMANVAGDHLLRLCELEPRLGKHIEYDLSELRTDLEQAAAGLKHENINVATVDSVKLELLEILPALLLMQGGGYQDRLNELIDNLQVQAGQGHLNPAELALLSKLQLHESALSKLPRAKPADWQKVAYLLEDFGRASRMTSSAPDKNDGRQRNG